MENVNTYKSINLIISKINVIKNIILTDSNYITFITDITQKKFIFDDKIWTYWSLRCDTEYGNYITENIAYYDDTVRNLMGGLISACIDFYKHKDENPEIFKMYFLYRGMIQDNMRRLNQLYVNIKIKK